MVAVDDERKPVAVPPLRPFTLGKQRRHSCAEVRKQLDGKMIDRPVILKAERILAQSAAAR